MATVIEGADRLREFPSAGRFRMLVFTMAVPWVFLFSPNPRVDNNPLVTVTFLLNLLELFRLSGDLRKDGRLLSPRSA